MPDKFNIEGRFYGELPASKSEFLTEFQEHDRKVERLKDRVTSFKKYTIKPVFLARNKLSNSVMKKI